MKRSLLITVLSGLCSLLVICAVFAQDVNVDVEFRQLRVQLLRSKLPIKDANCISQTLSELLGQGASRDDLFSITMDIYMQGVSGTDLDACLKSVGTLIKAGAETNEAGGVVLEGIDKGLRYGFKGGDIGLLDKMREAVREKEEKLREEKQKKEEKANNDKPQEENDAGSDADSG